MPQIPGIPTLDPVAKPYMSPQQAAIPGATTASLAGGVEEISAAGTELEGHILAAQRQLAAKQGELALDQHAEKTYEDLRKTTTPEQAQEVLENAQKEAAQVIAPYGKDPLVSRALDMYRQRIDLEMQHTTNARKATIITEQDKAANQLLGQKSLQEAITAERMGGDPKAARTKFELQLQSSVAHGTMTEQDLQLHMQKWDEELQKGVLEAGINSPDPAERKQVIEQLKTGKGKLDLSLLDEGTRNNLLTHAIETDHRLTTLSETANLNAGLNAVHQAFQSPEYVNNYPGQLKALGDENFLKTHGIVTADGTPDWVTAEKMRSYVTADHATNEEVLSQEADKIINQWSDLVARGDYSKASRLVLQNTQQLQAPEKNKGIAEKMIQSTRIAANRTDDDINPRTNAVEMTSWYDRFDAGEDYNDPKVKAELMGDPRLKSEAIVQIGRYARVHEDKVISGSLALANDRIKKFFPTSTEGMVQAIATGRIKPGKGQDLSSLMSLELESYSQAREALAGWVTQQQELAAAGKRKSLTQDEILQQGEEISRNFTPSVEKQITAMHADKQRTSQSKVIEQYSESRKQYRYSTDGGKTWQQGRAPQ